MKRFLLCAGLYGEEHGLTVLHKLVEERRPDAILFAGGIVCCPRRYEARASTQWGMTAGDARFVEHFFEMLGSLNVFTALIPGPEDTPLDEFLRVGMHAELEFPNVHLVHGTLLQKANVAICGIGACHGVEAAEGDGCSRVLAEYLLRPLWTARQPRKVLLLPAAPPGHLGGPEGRPMFGDFINSYHPTLCVVGGPSQRQGSERIVHTLVVNPGSLAAGQAAWLDWSRKKADQIEFIHQSETVASER